MSDDIVICHSFGPKDDGSTPKLKIQYEDLIKLSKLEQTAIESKVILEYDKPNA